MALTQISTAGVKDDAVTAGKIPANAVGSSELADNAVDTAAIANDAVTGAKIADDAVGAEHIEQLDADLSFADNVNASFGAGADLTIDHNGTHSIIDNNTGRLYVLSDDTWFKDKDDGDLQAKFVHDGGCEFYYDNSKKFETSNYGTWLGDNSRITLGGSAGSPDCHLYHDGTDTNLQNITGDLVIKSTSGGAKAIVAKNGAAVQIFHNNVKTAQTEAGGVWNVRGPTDGNATLMLSANDGGDNGDSWRWLAEGETNTKKITLTNNPDGNWETSLTATGNAGVELYYNNSKTFETKRGGARVSSKLGVNCDPNGTHPVQVEHNQQYIIGIKNTAAHNSYFPWLMHKAIPSGQAFGIHFNGISGDKFHADQNGAIYLAGETAAANALDDYEEGTWTPTDGSGASISITNNNTAAYTKIGRLVYIQFDVTYASNSSSSHASLGNLPFSLATAYGSGVVGWTDKDSANGIVCHVDTGSRCALMDNSSSSSSGGKHLRNDELSGTRMIGTAMYLAAT